MSKTIRERSGQIDSDDPLVAFLYLLLRDKIVPGELEEIMKQISSEDESKFSNGWLALYAKDIAKRLKNEQSDSGW